MKTRNVTRHIAITAAAFATLIGVALPAFSPFLTNTASAATPTQFETIVGGANSDNFTNKIICEGHMERAALAGVLDRSLHTNANNIGPNFWNDIRNTPILPPNVNTAGWETYLRNNLEQQVSVISLYAPANPSASFPDKCGGRHTNGSLGDPHIIMVPVAGNSPTDPTLWVANQQAPNFVDGTQSLFIFFQKTGGAPNGGTRGNFIVQYVTDQGGINHRLLTDQIVNGVVMPSSGQIINTNIAGGRFTDAATIAVTLNIAGKEVHEVYRDYVWDKQSFYFLEISDDKSRQNRTFSEQGINPRVNPFCDTSYKGTPFVWLPSGDSGNSPPCDDNVYNLINLGFSYPPGDFDRRTSQLGASFGNRDPQMFDYGPGGEFIGGPDVRSERGHLPLGRNIQLNRTDSEIWFYVNGERTAAWTVWSAADGNEQNYIGEYAYIKDTKKFELLGGGCPIAVADINFSGVTSTSPKAPVNLTLRHPNENCQRDFQVANIFSKVSQSDFENSGPQDEKKTAVEDKFCTDEDSGALGWLLCPLGLTLKDAGIKLDQFILSQMEVDIDDIFGSNTSSTAFRTAWSLFRNMAYALLVILGVIMVVSQIMSLDLFDAYAIRKMLPKMVVAAIVIPLLWPILQFLFEMANDSHDAVTQLIKTPFIGVGRDATLNTLLTGGVGGVGLGVFFTIGGWAVFFATLGSMLLSLMGALFILTARDIVVYSLIIASPVAVVCAVFEPFKKAFMMWRTFLVTILLSLPAVAAVLAASKVAASISVAASENAADKPLEQGWGILLAYIFLITGYALFWKVFQQIDRVSGQLGTMVGKVTGKAQKALAEQRSNGIKKRLNEAVEGRRNFGGLFGYGANRVAGLVRRGRLSSDVGAGAFGIGAGGRANYKEAVRTMQSGVAAKMMEQDKDRAGGDDDAMRLLARRGMNGSRFVDEYSSILRRREPGMSEGEATARARRALGLSQSSLGANAGTNAMRVAAQRSLLKSNTSYRSQLVRQADGSWREEPQGFNDVTKTMYGDVSELVNDGLITVADGAAMIKSNGARADRAGVGFGNAMSQLDRVARHGTGALDELNGEGISHIQGMADEVLLGTGPGQMVGQRHEAVRILAPEMRRRAQEALLRDRTPDGQQQLGREFIEQIAQGARLQDLGGQLPEMNAALSANGFLGRALEEDPAGNPIGPTMGQWIEFMRSGGGPGNQTYDDLHRAQVAQIQAEIAAGTRPAGTPADIDLTAHAATRAEIADVQRIFQEYRREYNTGYQQPQPGGDPGAGGPPAVPMGVGGAR